MPDFIIEWSNGTEWYYKLPLRIPLNGPTVLNGIPLALFLSGPLVAIL